MAQVRFIARRARVHVGFDFSELRDALAELERSLRSTVKELRPERPVNVVVEFSKTDRAIIVIDLGDDETTLVERNAIEKMIVREVKRAVNHPVNRVVVLDGGMQEASDPQVVRILRIIGPCTKDSLRDSLEEKGFRVASIQWLNQRLDWLRQKGFVRYLGSGLFALTAEALGRMPATTDRNSLDVQRALRFGRTRTW